MALSQTELDADLAEMIGDMPTACTITQGKRRQVLSACAVGEIAAGETLHEEGIMPDDSTPIVIRRAGLAWVPAAGALVETAGRTLRVIRVRYMDGDAAIMLECEAQTK